MSNRAGPGRCRVKRAWVDVESSGHGSMSSQAGSGEVESSGLGRCQVDLAKTDVEWSGPGLG